MHMIFQDFFKFHGHIEIDSNNLSPSKQQSHLCLSFSRKEIILYQ